MFLFFLFILQSPYHYIVLMKTFLFWTFLLLLILIHAIDMELTTHYIGNQWEHETFPLMSLCIKQFGINVSIWMSRVACYLYFLVCYNYRNSNYFLFSMFLLVILYYTSMVDWLFTLCLVRWPL